MNGESYFDDLLKINLTTQLSTYKKIIPDRKQLMKTLDDGGFINIGGYEIGKELQKTICEQTLSEIVEKLSNHEKVCCVSINRPKQTASKPEPSLLASDPSKSFRTVELHQFWNESRFYQPNQTALFEASLAVSK